MDPFPSVLIFGLRRLGVSLRSGRRVSFSAWHCIALLLAFETWSERKGPADALTALIAEMEIARVKAATIKLASRAYK